MTLTLLDDFNRADGNVGSNWTKREGGGTILQVASNKCAPVNATESSMYWNGEQFASNHEVSLDISTTAAATSVVYFVMGASDPTAATYTGYIIQLDVFTGIYVLYRGISGSYTTIGSSGGFGGMNGITVTIRKYGTTFHALHNGVVVWGQEDTTPLIADGYVGFGMTSTLTQVDNFQAGNIPPAGVLGFDYPGTDAIHDNPDGSIVVVGRYTTGFHPGTVGSGWAYLESVAGSGTRSQKVRLVIFQHTDGADGSGSPPLTTVLAVTDEVTVDQSTPAGWIEFPGWTNNGGPPSLSPFSSYYVGIWWGTQTNSGKFRIPVGKLTVSGHLDGDHKQQYNLAATYSSSGDPTVSGWNAGGAGAYAIYFDIAEQTIVGESAAAQAHSNDAYNTDTLVVANFHSTGAGGVVGSAWFYLDGTLGGSGTRSQKVRFVILGTNPSDGHSTSQIVGLSDELTFDQSSTGGFYEFSSWTNFGGPPTLDPETAYFLGLWWGTQVNSGQVFIREITGSAGGREGVGSVTYSSTVTPTISTPGHGTGNRGYVAYVYVTPESGGTLVELTLSATGTAVSTISKLPSVIRACLGTGGVTVSKRPIRTLLATASEAATLGAARTATFSALASGVGVVTNSKLVNKSLAVTATGVATVSRALTRTYSATATGIGFCRKTVHRIFAAIGIGSAEVAAEIVIIGHGSVEITDRASEATLTDSSSSVELRDFTP